MTALRARLLLAGAFAAMSLSAQSPPRAPLAPFQPAANQGLFVLLTDIHFNPFADPSIVPALAAAPVEQWQAIFAAPKRTSYAYGSDTTYPLLQSALAAASAAALKPDYILLTGDLLSHGFQKQFAQFAGGTQQQYDSFLKKTMLFVSGQIQSAFPQTPLYGALGNNDAVCGDYKIAPASPLLSSLATQWSGISGQPAAVADFSAAGFYAVPHPTVPSQELISLNSVFWSTLYQNACSATGPDPGDAELSWLEWTLYRLRLSGKKAAILMHIPPGIDAYASRAPSCTKIQPFWQARYTVRFSTLLNQYAAQVTDIYVGHTHADDFRLLRNARGNAFAEIHTIPAISPVFQNNPAFQLGLYSLTDGSLLDYATLYLTNLEKAGQQPPDWKMEYSFEATYHYPSLTPENLQKLADAIKTSSGVRAQFAEYYATETPKGSPITPANWRSYACAQTNMDAQGYSQCACPATP